MTRDIDLEYRKRALIDLQRELQPYIELKAKLCSESRVFRFNKNSGFLECILTDEQNELLSNLNEIIDAVTEKYLKGRQR